MSPTPDKAQRGKYFRGRTVLVTGASGFIGAPLSSALVRAGACVHAVSRGDGRKRGENIRWWKGDLEDFGETRKILQLVKPSLVVHLAGYAWGNQDLSSVPATFYGNLATTVNVLTAASESGCKRIVLPGSLEEPEDPGTIPNSPYSAAKWACSVYGRMFYENFAIEVVQTRIFMTYGPGQNDKKIIPYIILSLLNGNYPVLQSPDRLVDWIYIDDVVEGLLAASSWNRLDNRTLDIGSGIGMTIESVAENIFHLMKMAPPPIRFKEKPFRRHEVVRVAEVEDTYKRTGWRPHVSINVGLLKTIAWYKKRRIADPEGNRGSLTAV